MDMVKRNITPEMAAGWLTQFNTSNRLISMPTVKKYASDIASGRWRNTHQNAIAFYRDGSIADGQHRLMAIVRAGVDVDMFVATGLDRDDGMVIDQGRSRTVADGLRISGVLSNNHYITARVAVIKLIRLVETGNQTAPTLAEVADLIELIDDSLSRVLPAMGSAPGRIGNAMLRSALVVADIKFGKDTAAHMAKVMVTGIPENDHDVTLVRLRNWLFSRPRSGGMKNRTSTYLTCLRAIHAHANGETLGVIRSTDRIYINSGIFDEK